MAHLPKFIIFYLAKLKLQLQPFSFSGHRAHSVYVGVHVPGGRRHSQRRRKHHHGKSDSSGDERQPEVERPGK